VIDHFKCYAVRSKARPGNRRVRLRDQFHREFVHVLRPRFLCNPVQKNDTTIRHPVEHLVCYQIRDVRRGRPFRRRQVATTNQFGSERLDVIRPRLLCVPSLKVVL
jgi:hypothetical protein